MLVELLAATGLGMAMWSSQQRQRRVEALMLPRNLLLEAVSEQPSPSPQPGEYVESDLPSHIPSLFATMELCKTIYAVSISDGYVTDTFDGLEDEDAEYEAKRTGNARTDEEGTREVCVTRYDCVPTHIAEQILAGDYADGYDAHNILRKNCTAETDIWSWDMYQEKDFEDWWDEDKESSRDDFMYNRPLYKIPAGSLLYHSTDVYDEWEKDFDAWERGLDDEDSDEEHGIEGLKLMNKRETAEAELTEEDWTKTATWRKPRPGPRRLLVFRAKESISVYRLEDYEIDDFDRYFETDLDDPEEVNKAFKEHSRHLDGNGVLIIDKADPTKATVVLTEDGIYDLELARIESAQLELPLFPGKL